MQFLSKAISILLCVGLIITPAFAKPTDNRKGKKTSIKTKRTPAAKPKMGQRIKGAKVRTSRRKAALNGLTPRERRAYDALAKKYANDERFKNIGFKKNTSASEKSAAIKRIDAAMASKKKNFDAGQKAAFKAWNALSPADKIKVLEEPEINKIATTEYALVVAGAALAVGLYGLYTAEVREEDREAETGGVQGEGGDAESVKGAVDF